VWFDSRRLSNGGEKIKITIGIVSANAHGTDYADLDVALGLTAAEKSTLQTHSIPIPGVDGKMTHNLLKKCFITQGDFYREVGIPNFKTFQPDWHYFAATSSEGWQSCIGKIVADVHRDDVLRRIGQIIANKIGLFTQKITPIAISTTTTDAGPGATAVNLTDVTGKNLKLLIGNKVFVAHSVDESAMDSALIDTAKGELEANATAQIKGFETEFSNNLVLMTKQYEKQIKEMKDKMKSQLPAMTIPDELLREHIQVTVNDHEYKIYIPIHLQFKYLTTSRQVWELKKKWQLQQDGYLMLAIDNAWHLRWTWLYDKKFKDKICMWHTDGKDLCLGTYEPKLKSLSDVPRIRDDIAMLFETIYTGSIGSTNITTLMNELYGAINDAPREWFEEIEDEDRDFSTVANRTEAKDAGGAIWSTT